MTQTEVLVVLGMIVILAGIAWPAIAQWRERSNRIHCVSRLKNLGLAHRIFASDNTNQYPFELSTRWGGTREWSDDPANLWKHFAILSNELGNPQLLRCPADHERPAARTWSEFSSSRNLSYFLGAQAREEHPQSILMGDRNITLNGTALDGQRVTMQSNSPVAFDRRLHRFAGNLLLGDGSVQQVTTSRLREQLFEAAQRTTNITWVFP